MMKKSVALLATLVMFVGTDISVAAPKVHLRMATTVSSPHVWYLGAEYFAKRVAELSNNEIEVSIHGGGSVGNENAIANGLRLGSLDMMILSFTPLASLVPEGAVFCIPYIFTGYDHNARVMKTGSPVFNLMQKYVERRNVGFKVLATAGGGARCYLNTLRPIVTPEDMKDMKIRTVTNSMTKKIWETVGAVPMAVSATEAYSAMQTGVCNAIEASLALFNSARLCEIAKYLSLSRHEFVVTNISISDLAMRRLSKEHYAVVKKVAEETGEFVTKTGIENDSKLVDLMVQKDALKVNEIDKDAFIKLFTPLQNELAENLAGTKDGLELLNAIRDMASEEKSENMSVGQNK
jgi:tripartite ATP-independent transporter DctP family solute receptor